MNTRTVRRCFSAGTLLGPCEDLEVRVPAPEKPAIPTNFDHLRGLRGLYLYAHMEKKTFQMGSGGSDSPRPRTSSEKARHSGEIGCGDSPQVPALC
jgi:hypothetical protein